MTTSTPATQGPINSELGSLRERREIRVFISSTFRDMMRERDLLVKSVFPELRRICAQRFVTFTEVDLRWGITEEEAAEGRVLPLCLTEIERSRPYFLCLLGERYGWIPNDIRAEVLDKEPWLNDHVYNRTSVTELEILHGVLNRPWMAGQAFFYLRSPAWIEALPESQRQEMVETNIPADVVALGEKEATGRTQERRARLATLKERIRTSGLRLVDGYESPEALAGLVREHFCQLIDRLFPEDQAPDPLDRERFAQEAHARSKLFACVDRPAHLAALDAHAGTASIRKSGFVVTGESGGGKTVLLSAWARYWGESNPKSFLFQHYFGATPESASPESFLRRLLGELKRRFEIEEDVPSLPEQLREALPRWLENAARQGRVVLVLDGLNQVQGSEADRSLDWLPRQVPPGLTAVASALPGRALDALRERGWIEHDLRPATDVEIDAMVTAYLTIHARKLRSDLHRCLVMAPGARNPLYLRTVLEELRQFGSFEGLPQHLALYLAAVDPQDLFLRVLNRWEEDFDAGQGLVSRAISLLWAARHGLSESEWLELLGNREGMPLPRAHWTPFFIALEPHLSRRGGLFSFGHGFLRQAAEARFLPDDGARHSAHSQLAAYFSHQGEFNPRKRDELPWQLLKMEDFDALERTLLDVDLFLSLSGIDRFELWRYWHEMPPTRRGFVRAYSHATVSWQRSLGDSPRYELALNELAHIYHACGEREASSSLMEEVLRLARALYPLDDIRVAIRKNNYACTLCHSSRHAEAEPLFQEALPVYIRHFGYLHPDTWGVRESIAVCHFNTGRIIQGLAEEEACLEWFRKHRGDLHFDTLNATYNLACAMERAERPNEAARLFSRAHEGFSRTLGPEHPTTVSCAGAARRIVKTSKQYAEDAVAEPTPGDDLLLRSLQSAASYETKGDHENALTILDELEPICFEWSDAAAMARCLFAKARALRGLGREELAVAEAKTALSFATDAATSLVEPLRLFLESPRSGEGAGRGEILWSERLGTLEDNQSSSDLQNKAEGSSETDFFLRRIQILSAKADVSPLHLRQLALDAYMVGHYTLATSLLQRVIAAGFEMPGAHCHLARIALVTGELAAAQDHAEQAWEHRAEAPPYVTARILWLQLAAEMAASTALANEAKRLGQLKTVLYAEGAHTEWTMTPVLESLRSRVSEDDHALLTALAAALSSADKLFALDEFPAWCAAQPEPLASNSSHEEEAC